MRPDDLHDSTGDRAHSATHPTKRAGRINDETMSLLDSPAGYGPRMMPPRAFFAVLAVAGLSGAMLVSCSDSTALTSCQSVQHIGDSLTAGMMSPNQIPDPNNMLDAQYRGVGVADVRVDGAAGRTIHEVTSGQTPGVQVAAAARAAGYTGCWVIELGTNDTALIVEGSPVGAQQRIDEMMAVIGTEPVMWVSTVTETQEGSYASDNMKIWNSELLDSQARYPNMRLYNWTSASKPEWFAPDGIHYTPEGFTELARRIPDALAAKLPK